MSKSIDVTIKGLNKEGLKKIAAMVDRLITKGDKVFAQLNQEDRVEEILEIIGSYGGRLISLIPQKETLEDIFIKETQSR